MQKKVMERIVFLDYMRIIAFMSVLVGHEFYHYIAEVISNADYNHSIRTITHWIAPIFQGGAAGVVIFFLTSGYIITHVLQKETTRDFIIRRLFRIFPLYIFAVLAQLFFMSAVLSAPLPDAKTLIAQISLTGDFFDTPYTLAGVEWTLRIEILFYLLMAVFKSAGTLEKKNLLPCIYFALSASFFYAPAFPDFSTWSDGYLNIYAPFLFIGSCTYLIERKLSNRILCGVAACAMYFIFCLTIDKLQPKWSGSYFAELSLGIFFVSWYLRRFFADGNFLKIASDMTYSVYLFHGWLWGYLAMATRPLLSDGIWKDLLILITLLLICYVLTYTIEKQGIKSGKSVTSYLKKLDSRLRNKATVTQGDA